jgi:hypothetical protein
LFSTSYDQIRDKSTHRTKCTIFKKENVWKIETQNENYITEKLILATGSNPKIWEMLQSYGHAIVNPYLLYLRSIKDARIKELPGVAATVKVKDTKLESTFINYPLGNERTNRFKIISLGNALFT